MAEPTLIKVCLTNKGEDTETPWAHDLGPAPGAPPGSRKVKLVNVPFMHAKPTWGDVIVVTPVTDGFPTWDRDGLPWKQIGTRIVEDGGRWAMIVDYIPTPDVTDAEAFEALIKACNTEFVCEGAWGPRAGEPGRVYLAVPKQLTAEQVMDKLVASRLPMRLIQVHPEPKKRTRSGTETGITPAQPRKPAPTASPVVSAKKSRGSAPEMPAPLTVAPESSGPVSAAKAAPQPARSDVAVDDAWGKPDASMAMKASANNASPIESAPSKSAAKPSATTKAAPATSSAPIEKPTATASPAAKAAAQPAANKSASTSTAKSAAKKPAITPAAKKPAAKSAAKPAGKQPAKPAAKQPAGKAAPKKPAAKAAAKKPAAKAAAKKPAAKPAGKKAPAKKPAAKKR